MKEQFPKKKVGDSLAAEHVDKLSKVASRFANVGGSTNQLTLHTGSTFSNASLFPWAQFLVEVSNKQISGDDEEDSGLYLVKIRWYSNQDTEWKTNDDKEYELDATELTSALEIEDKLVAFWDQQRGMFVPIESAQGRYFQLVNNLAPGGSALAIPRNWDSDIGDYVADRDADTFIVVDVLERFRGRRGDISDPDNIVDGSKGFAISRNGQWEIEHLQPHALFIVCKADGAFTTSTEPVPVKDVVVIQPVDTALLMEDPVTLEALVTDVANPHDWEGPTGARIVGMWNDVLEVFEMLQVDC